MGTSCARSRDEKVIVEIDTKNGMISRIEVGTQQLKLFYEYDKEDDKVVLYMSLHSGAHRRMLAGVVPPNFVEKLIGRFLASPSSSTPELLQYVEQIASGNDKQAKIRIGNDEEGFTVSFGYKLNDEGMYHVYAEVMAIYDEKHVRYVYEEDYVNTREEIRPRLLDFVGRVVTIARQQS